MIKIKTSEKCYYASIEAEGIQLSKGVQYGMANMILKNSSKMFLLFHTFYNWILVVILSVDGSAVVIYGII